MSAERRIIRFRGALYAQACGLGDGCAYLSADDVAALLSEQYFNVGKTTAQQLKDKWVRSDRFVLTHIYPSMLLLGVSPGKEGVTFSAGLPLVIDEDYQEITDTWRGVQPIYLVLDGQNRVVKLRREAPREKYPAYVGNRVLSSIERITADMEQEVQDAEAAVREHKTHPTPSSRRRVHHFFTRGLVTTDELGVSAGKKVAILAFQGALYSHVSPDSDSDTEPAPISADPAECA